MKIHKIKKEKRYTIRNDRPLGIQMWGYGNDYPQQVMDIIRGSCTGLSCISNYSKFIAGQGFKNKDIYEYVVNKKGNTADDVLKSISEDYANLGGFVIHLNFNMALQVVEMQHIPFETVRLGSVDDDGRFLQVAVHWDWARRYGAIRRWRKEDISYIDLYNPDPKYIRERIKLAGGIGNWNGMAIYISNQGMSYPIPVCDAVLTDMSTEEGLSNVSYRNARNNFFPGAVIVNKRNDNKPLTPVSPDIDNDSKLNRPDDTEDDISETFKHLQGDENAGKMVVVDIDPGEDFKIEQFETKNFDKDFDITSEMVDSRIGRRFNQPPILRSKDVGGNFGADAMKNAYNYYNSVTVSERLLIERTFKQIFSIWHETVSDDYSILPLSYTSDDTNSKKIGDSQSKDVIDIITNTDITDGKKESILINFYGIDEEIAKKLIYDN